MEEREEKRQVRECRHILDLLRTHGPASATDRRRGRRVTSRAVTVSVSQGRTTIRLALRMTPDLPPSAANQASPSAPLPSLRRAETHSLPLLAKMTATESASPASVAAATEPSARWTGVDAGNRPRMATDEGVGGRVAVGALPAVSGGRSEVKGIAIARLLGRRGLPAKGVSVSGPGAALEGGPVLDSARTSSAMPDGTADRERQRPALL
jgi:hypothetical protein